MKRINYQTIEELANSFSQELEKLLPIWVLPDKALYYKGFLIKELPNKNWGVFHPLNKSLIDQFYTKSCALIAANSYISVNLEKFSRAKQLDSQYWGHYFDFMLYNEQSINVTGYEEYQIILDKLDNAECSMKFYKNKISKLFSSTFM